MQETGTDPSVLKNFKFGLDASLEDLVDVSASVLENVGNKVNEEISNTQLESGFVSTGYLGKGAPNLTMRNIEDQLGSFMASIFGGSQSGTVNNNQKTVTNSANFGDMVFNNNMDVASFGVMLNQFFGQAVML